MQFNRLNLGAFVGGILLAALTANAQAQVALSGQVTSTQEAQMEGVLVNVKREGSTVTTTVVTNDAVPCRPCALRRCPDPVCMTSIEVDEVHDRVRRVLAAGR